MLPVLCGLFFNYGGKMKYYKKITLKDGRECVLKNGDEADGKAGADIFNLTHGETDFLLTYPEEGLMSAKDESEFLKEKTESENEIEILAFVDGRIAGTAGFEAVGNKEKLRHRAEFGVSVAKEFWGLGIGKELLNSCIECAKKAGFVQLELSVIAENERAIAMYKKAGFKEYGRNPKGFKKRPDGFQELVYMFLEL